MLKTRYILFKMQKKRTDNKSITAKEVVNKLMSQKSVCAECGADCGLWSIFVKEYKPDKKNKSFHKLQNMHLYCKKFKKHTGNMFPKKKICLDFKGENQRNIKMCYLFD